MQSGFHTTRIGEVLQFGFAAQQDWWGEERLLPVAEPGLALHAVSPESPGLSRPLAEKEAVLLGQNQAQAQKESMAQETLGLGSQGLSRKGSGLGSTSHPSAARRECPASHSHPCPVSAEAALGPFLLWVWIKGSKGQGAAASECPKAPSCFAHYPLLHLHLLAFVA